MKTNKNSGSKRLSKAKWEEIRKLLNNEERNISKIARKYNISRHSLYAYSWRHNIFQKKEKSWIKRFVNLLREGRK